LSDILKELKEKVAAILPELTYFIGYGTGVDPLHVVPVFIREAKDVEKLCWNHFCVNNPATYLPPQKHHLLEPQSKIGVLLKGCDSRSVIQLLQEGIITREKLFILGLPCWGMIDVVKLGAKIDVYKVNRLELDEQTIMAFTNTSEISADISELLYDKCLGCEYPNTLIYDEFIGEKRKDKPEIVPFAKISQLEKMSLAERAAFWQNEFARCIRCKACRNVCPMCYCQDQCLLDTRNPHWAREKVDVASNQWFHLIRAFHLAGRCTECGECARVCPVNIPINLLPMKMNQELFELFGWRSGIKQDEKPPLMSFKLEEEKIK
jgi:formate dehydrogenase subunit beta